MNGLVKPPAAFFNQPDAQALFVRFLPEFANWRFARVFGHFSGLREKQAKSRGNRGFLRDHGAQVHELCPYVHELWP
jgi:hypothetical protein